MVRNRKLMYALTAAGCAAMVSTVGIKAAAGTSGNASVGNIVADGGQVAYYASDMSYLSNEIGTLQSEIDYSLLDAAFADGGAVLSGDSWRDLLSSHGIINYDNGKIVADAADVSRLADSIDALGDDYAAVTCRALNRIGTFFDAAGNANHVSQAAETTALSCEQLSDGILRSQSVDHLEAAPVIADNITAGAAAWVNGQCIIGNGADNDRAYRRGIEDGENGDDDDIDIRYTCHVHRNGVGEEVTEEKIYDSVDPGGCYVKAGHEHNKTGTCPSHTSTTKCGGAITYKWHWCTDYDGDGVSDWSYCAFCSKCGSHKSKGYSHDQCQDTTSVKVYDCGNYANTWKFGCGKEAGQIESVTIIVRKNRETEM